MKKIMLIALATIILTACGSKKNKQESGTTKKTTDAGPLKPATAGKDGELTQWLNNKKLVSTKEEPKYDMWNKLQLKADGSCIDKDGAAATWVVNNGKFVFQSIINMKMDMEKRAEDTLVFKGLVKDDVYVLAPLD